MNDQKVAVISAGASGIGRVVAEALHTAGYALFILDIDYDQVMHFRREFGETSATVCDVSDPDQVATAFETFGESYDRIDVLVNNAGISGPTSRLEDIEVSAWKKTINTDLNSLFYVTRHAIPIMKQQAAAVIINMASNAGLAGCPLRSPYAAAKWATVGLTKTWAMELGDWNIRVNALCPGSVSGPRIDQVIERDARVRGKTPEEVRTVYERQNSLGRFVRAEDIAAMVCFLAGEGGVNISGQAIAIDGNTESLADWSDQ